MHTAPEAVVGSFGTGYPACRPDHFRGSESQGHLLGRYRRLGGEQRQQLGDRAQCRQWLGSASAYCSRQWSRRHLFGWHSRLGGQHFARSLAELNASDGSNVRAIPLALILRASHRSAPTSGLANSGSNSVTELDASDGAVLQTITVGANPESVSLDSTHVWLTNDTDGTVTELALSPAHLSRPLL